MPEMYPQVKEILTAFAKSLPSSQSRKVCLSYDEINVTADIDDDTRLCRIFALNGIGSDWQCILSYDIIENGLNTIGRLKNSIAQRICVAYECGFDVICISADQCPISQKLYSICKTFNSGDNFKAKYLPQLSSCNPLDKQIWFIPDLTHLIIGITNAILKSHFDIDGDMITKARNFYPEACITHFRPKGYYYGIRDFEAVQNVFSNEIINKIKEIEPESETKAKTVEFLERMKAFVECFSNLSRDNYESVLNEWIIFFNSHGCSKVKSCLSGFKFVADDFFNCNEDIYSIDIQKCSTEWIEELFFYIRSYPFTTKLTLDVLRFHIGRILSSYVAKGTVRVQLCANSKFLLNEIKYYGIKTSYLQNIQNYDIS
ncbi:uncharacterized protein LOC142222584 isoform X1 [Haematobia irritans]|uniref:uncharacterized protein LOC142222584 isoform X1 n=1 Tax=Haematobia irritans TaxID=7368 RepID=UPI003F4F6F67